MLAAWLNRVGYGFLLLALGAIPLQQIAGAWTLAAAGAAMLAVGLRLNPSREGDAVRPPSSPRRGGVPPEPPAAPGTDACLRGVSEVPASERPARVLR